MPGRDLNPQPWGEERPHPSALLLSYQAMVEKPVNLQTSPYNKLASSQECMPDLIPFLLGKGRT